MRDIKNSREWALTQSAHEAAKTQFYPTLFRRQADELRFSTDDERDMRQSVDRIIEVPVSGERAPLSFAVSERFLDVSKSGYKHLTITVWNGRSNTPSELHKLHVEIFVFGYYCQKTGRLTETWAIDTRQLKMAVAFGQIAEVKPRLENVRNQTFARFDLRELYRGNYVILYKNAQKGDYWSRDLEQRISDCAAINLRIQKQDQEWFDFESGGRR